MSTAPAAGSIQAWAAMFRPYAWTFWSAVLLIYVIRTKNITVLVIALAITWIIRTYATRIDKALAPIWPVRDRIPAPTRKLLGWLLPVAIGLYISLQPALWRKLGWLPVVGPTASLSIFTALIGGLTAYVFVREPSQSGAP